MENDFDFDWQDLRGGDAIPLIRDALSAESVSTTDFESILYKVGYVDCVFDGFYAALDALVAIVDRQPDTADRQMLLVLMCYRILFAVEQRDCPPQYTHALESAKIRCRDLFFSELCKEPKQTHSEALLIGIAACLGNVRAANAIRDIDC